MDKSYKNEQLGVDEPLATDSFIMEDRKSKKHLALNTHNYP